MGFLSSYSGIVLNQNATTTNPYSWRPAGGGTIYQTFTLPANYQRGTSSSELRIPDLSGLQILTYIKPGAAIPATVDYQLTYFINASGGWQPLASGTVIGSHSDGQSWFDIIFDNPVPVTQAMLSKQFRFSIQTRTATNNQPTNQPVTVSNGAYVINGQSYTADLTPGVPFPITVNGLPAFLLLSNGAVTYSIQQGVETLYLVSPTPLLNATSGRGQAYQADGITPLLGSNTTASLNFRVLGLTADSGTNFLGNNYRACVIQTRGASTDTTNPANTTASGGQYWMSPPQPSRFAVQNLYFDVRPTPASPSYGVVNMIGNPSFEYDVIGQAPQWWSAFSSGGTVVDQTVRSSWTGGDGVQSLHMKYTFSAANQQLGIISGFQSVSPTTGGQPTSLTCSMNYDMISGANANLYFTFLFYDNTQTLLPSPYGTMSFDPSTIGIGSFSATTTIPANAVYVRCLVSALSTGVGSLEAYVDAIQVTQTAAAVPYFDGDSPDCQWTGQRGQSPSVQVIDPAPGNNTVVIDGVLVDPITPNMTFNVYYTSDDSFTVANMTESDWEQKLWTRVPQVFVCNQRQQYVFPEPVSAKYIKIEFTNLQSRPYNPGNFQKPLLFKKFPTWVAAYFLDQMLSPSFVASKVNVQYDALQFAYNYFLDDLQQAPASPSTPSTDAIDQLTSYFNTPVTGVDASTLAKIDLNMKPFQQALGTNVDTSSSLGAFTTTIFNTLSNTSQNPVPSIAEGGTLPSLDLSTVSSLQRESVILEQGMPAMYFFLTCRHAYKEIAAPLQHDRAYFAGVNEIALVRHNYSSASDTPLYIESGADAANTQLSDWVVDSDGNWYTY